MSLPNNQQKWIIRDAEGKIYGPFTTPQVLEQIDSGYFLGGEEIAGYPGGNWLPISRSPQFSDRLLDALAAESRPRPRRDPTSQILSPEITEERSIHDHQEEPSKGLELAERESPPAQNRRASGVSEPLVPQTDRISKPSASPAHNKSNQFIGTNEPEIKEGSNRLFVPLLFFAAALGLFAAAAILSGGSKTDSTAGIRLIAPRSGQAELPDARIREKLRRAQASFQVDTFSGYLKAQNELVEIVEGAPRSPDAAPRRAEWLSSLCMTYRELWPYSRQDAVDLKTVAEVTREAKLLDPGGRHGTTCEIIGLLLEGRRREAQGLTESMLVEEGQISILFEIRGDLYSYFDDDRSAVGYFNQARNLWPMWKKNSIQEARAHAKIGQYPTAIELYGAVIRAVPSHAVAKVELGLLESLKFNQLDKGFELLNSALEGKEKLPPILEADALYGLAQIYERRNQASRALDYARRAFKINSGNLSVKQMIVRLSGSEQAVPSADPRGLMYLGDQYVRAGDCVSAQAEFKSAFEADPKSGTAAMKASKCLWELNQSVEAIEWMHKAIRADPKLIAAYVALADYYATRYDFLSAVQTLRKAQRVQPKSHEIFRGFAQVDLRRNNFKGAEDYALRALKLYGTDIESNLIMASAQLGLQNYLEAQRYADRSIELDYNNIEAHILRARAEAGLGGVDAAAAYLQSMINRYVITKGEQPPQAAVDFRVALGEIYLKDERLVAAEESFKQAVAIDDNSKEAFMGYGKALQAQGRSALALEYFLKAAVLDPTDADPIFSSGQVYLDVGKLKEATSQFERVLKINDRYPRVHVQLGRVFLRQGEAKKALEQARAERAMNPELVDAFTLAAEANFALKQYSNCAAEYQQAAKRVRNAGLLVRMARCYRLGGALDSAESLLRQAGSIESGNPELYKEQGAIYHMKGMADEAVTAYDTYLKLVPSAPDRADIEAKIRKVQSGDITFGE
jgi:tetratricopeptide (TPR) repeat protein